MSAQGVLNAAQASGVMSCLDSVLAIWREVLEPDTDGLDDNSGTGELDADSNFFLCGGDSLDLMRVLVRVRERLGVSLDLREAGTFSTPRRMAQCCAGAVPSQVGAPRLASPTGEEGGDTQACGSSESHSRRFKCSAGQHALWLAEQLGGGCGLYNTAVASHFTGPLQVPLLARALDLLLRRHEVLRCRFHHDAGLRRLTASVAAPCNVALKAEPLGLEDLQQVLLDTAAQPFDLEHGPLWRFRLLRTGDERWTLLFCLHHAVTDGWSGSVLLRNLAEHYTALMRDPAWQGHALNTEFRRSCAQPQPQPHPDADADLRWWRGYLAGADQLPSWPPTGTARWPFAMALEACVLPPATWHEVQRVSRSQQLRPAALFLTALRLAVLELGGAGELCIGMPANVREGSAQDAAVGYFVNLLVLRERVDGTSAGMDTVRQAQQALDETLCRRALPFTELMRDLKPLPLPSGNVWCDILFAFQNLPWTQPDFGNVSARIEALTLPRGQHPLKVEVLCGAGAYVCRVEYARECMTKATARGLLAALRCQLARLLESGALRSS
jgi:acyl carrier protein